MFTGIILIGFLGVAALHTQDVLVRTNLLLLAAVIGLGIVSTLQQTARP